MTEAEVYKIFFLGSLALDTLALGGVAIFATNRVDNLVLIWGSITLATMAVAWIGANFAHDDPDTDEVYGTEPEPPDFGPSGGIHPFLILDQQSIDFALAHAQHRRPQSESVN